MVFQGLYLWNTGWIDVFQHLEPESAARFISKGRGKGGIILLVFHLFPELLILAYGTLLFHARSMVCASARSLGLLKP